MHSKNNIFFAAKIYCVYILHNEFHLNEFHLHTFKFKILTYGPTYQIASYYMSYCHLWSYKHILCPIIIQSDHITVYNLNTCLCGSDDIEMLSGQRRWRS